MWKLTFDFFKAAVFHLCIFPTVMLNINNALLSLCIVFFWSFSTIKSLFVKHRCKVHCNARTQRLSMSRILSVEELKGSGITSLGDSYDLHSLNSVVSSPTAKECQKLFHQVIQTRIGCCGTNIEMKTLHLKLSD